MYKDLMLEGRYSLKDYSGKAVPPEYFLSLFADRESYEDVVKFVRGVDNDTGIPFLTKEEYGVARGILPDSLLRVLEHKGFFSFFRDRVYLRGRKYYINLDERLRSSWNLPEDAFNMLELGIGESSELVSAVLGSAVESQTLEERMIVGSLLDIHKNYLMILFTGLYESMKIDEGINIRNYETIRGSIEHGISSYYTFIMTGKVPAEPINPDKLRPVLDEVQRVVLSTGRVYDRRRYLAREFDHPGRMVLYASHLLSQIKDKGKRYDLLVNILNGSAEIGLAIQAIDEILRTGKIGDISIFDVDFARYSLKDKEDGEVSTYKEFETIAIPAQLRATFRQKVRNKSTLIVDDNINTGQSLYNVRRALEEIAGSVDISVAEVAFRERMIELIKKKLIQKGIMGVDPQTLIKLIEDDLTYVPIGWWRDPPEMLDQKRIERIIGLIP